MMIRETSEGRKRNDRHTGAGKEGRELEGRKRREESVEAKLFLIQCRCRCIPEHSSVICLLEKGVMK